MTKTHFKKLRNPNYIGSWDLMDDNGTVHDIIVTVTKVLKEQVHDGKGGAEDCPVLHFAECKPMVANATNLKTIAKVTGSVFIEDWVGHKLKLTVKKVRAFGDTHDAIRVANEVVKVEPKPQPKPAEPLPELTPDSDKWLPAVTHLQGARVTIADIKKKYRLSPENEKTLIENAGRS